MKITSKTHSKQNATTKQIYNNKCKSGKNLGESEIISEGKQVKHVTKIINTENNKVTNIEIYNKYNR